MGVDDTADGCPDEEHMWRLGGVVFHRFGSTSEYTCDRCGLLLAVGPGEVHPLTC